MNIIKVKVKFEIQKVKRLKIPLHTVVCSDVIKKNFSVLNDIQLKTFILQDLHHSVLYMK